MLELRTIQNYEYFRDKEIIIKKQDMDEIGASDAKQLRIILKSAIQKSKCSYVLLTDDNKILGVLGIREIDENTGMPWFLSDEIPQNEYRIFLEIIKNLVTQWKEEYAYLYNYTDKNNRVSHNWIEYLGFKLLYNEVSKKIDGRELIKFIWEKDSN